MDNDSPSVVSLIGPYVILPVSVASSRVLSLFIIVSVNSANDRLYRLLLGLS